MLGAVLPYPGSLIPSVNNWNVAVAVSTETAWSGFWGEGLFLLFLKTIFKDFFPPTVLLFSWHPVFFSFFFNLLLMCRSSFWIMLFLHCILLKHINVRILGAVIIWSIYHYGHFYFWWSPKFLFFLPPTVNLLLCWLIHSLYYVEGFPLLFFFLCREHFCCNILFLCCWSAHYLSQ